jgi:hypothetical protein
MGISVSNADDRTRAAGDSGDPLAEAHRALTARAGAFLDAHLQPALEALQTAGELLALDGDLDAMPGHLSVPPDVAVTIAERERAVSQHIADLVVRLRKDVDAVRAMVAEPITPMTAEEQFRYWIREAVRAAGRRERFTFSRTREVEVSIDFIQGNAEFLEVLVVGFVQGAEDGWERQMLASGESPAKARELSRLAAEPPWRFLMRHPELPLTEADALTLVAIGVVLGCWEAQPPIERLAELEGEIDEADVPFLSPSQRMLGVVHG